jgi:hypothetical protein
VSAAAAAAHHATPAMTARSHIGVRHVSVMSSGSPSRRVGDAGPAPQMLSAMQAQIATGSRDYPENTP